MKVLLVCNGPATAEERSVLARREVALPLELVRQGTDVTIALFGDSGGLRDDLRAAGIDAHIIQPALPPALAAISRLPVAAMRLRTLIARLDPDVVEASEPMPAIAAGIAQWHRHRPPVIVYRRQHAGGRSRALYASRLAARLCDRTLVSCEAMRQRAAADDHCDVQRIEIANPGAIDAGPVPEEDIQSARRTIGIDRSARVIGVVSRLRHEKGLDLVIRSLGYLVDLENVHLVIAGTGPEERVLRLLAASSSVPVHFTGHQHNVPVWLRAADVIVIPSRRESFGRVVLESMAAGRPVVAARTGGLAEAVVDGETGTLVPPGDEPALASAIREMLADPALGNRRGEAGRKRFLARYTIPHMATARIQAWQRSLDAEGAR